MDMNGMVDWLKGKLGMAQTPITGVDGTTYGPAQSRISRVPVVYSTSLAHQGEYNPQTDTISVNPTIDNQPMHPLMQHEVMHSILAKLGTNQPAATTSAPGYADIASRISPASGDPTHEAPAWAVSGDIYGVPTATRQGYLGGVIDNLNSLGRPDLATMATKDMSADDIKALHAKGTAAAQAAGGQQ